jgi:hypothetical protein
MSDLFEQLTAHLTANQIGHWSNPEEKAVCVDFPGIVGFYRVYARIDCTVGQLQVSGQTRLRAPEGSRATIAELVVLANQQRANGELELNQDASELRFHVVEDLAGDELSGEMIDRLIRVAHISVDAYLRAILSVIFGNEKPADALRQVELDHV